MNPLIPMFSITGKPTKQQIVNELENLKAANINGVMIYARSGMGTTYMAEDWLECCKTVIETAEKLQMEVWLYDDYNWPSGSCKHQVENADSSFIAKRFVYENGKLKIKQIEPDESGMVFEPFIVDLFNPKAVDCFISLTHEIYYKHFKKYFGNVIKGFFTDEPSFVYTATQDNTFPYYDGVIEDYKTACGSDLKNDICSFLNGKTLETFPSVFYRVLGERFEKSYFAKLEEWCSAHGVGLTGHAMCDDNVCSNIKTTGNWFDALNHFTVPGVDNITSEVNAFYELPYACLEALRRNGKKWAMTELFALGPDSMTFDRRANIIWHNAAFGINKFFLALTHLDAQGNIEKLSYFNHFGYANPNFGGLKLLAIEAEKAAIFSDKKPLAKVNIAYPLAEGFEALNNRNEEKIQSNLLKLIELLDSNQITWQILAPDEQNECAPTVQIKTDNFVVDDAEFDLEQLKVWVCKNVSSSLKVKNQKGELASGVFVREYTDGSVLVLDTKTSKKRNLVLEIENKKINFTLPTDGVFIANTNMQDTDDKNFDELIPKDFKVVKENNDLLRCCFDENGKFFFELKEETEITLNKLSTENVDFSVCLNGEAVSFPFPCSTLTHCFNPLYRESEPILLKSGKHSISVNTKKEFPFLPLAILSGENLTEHNFFGELKVNFKVKIPENCKNAFVIDENSLYTELLIDGKKIDEKIFANDSFSLPYEYFGKEIMLTLVHHSSLSPIFGESEYIKGLVEIDWCKNFATVPETVDLSKIKIILN